MMFRSNPHNQDQLVLVCKPPLLVLSEKMQGQLKLLRFLPIFIFFPFEKTKIYESVNFLNI